MPDEFDETVADALLTDEERGEVHHIQHHFADVQDENERAVLGWRATSIYVAAFKREIVRLRRLNDVIEQNHAQTNCRCGHGDESHDVIAICRKCAEGTSRDVILTGDFK